MDYSEYYLKNYVDKKERNGVKYRNSNYEFYRQEKEFSDKSRDYEPQIIFIQTPTASVGDSARKEYDLDETEYTVTSPTSQNAVPYDEYKQEKIATNSRNSALYGEYRQEKVATNSRNAPSHKKKFGKFRKSLIFTLILLLSIVSTFVASDFLTNGDLINAVFYNQKESATSSIYYCVIKEKTDNYEDCKISSIKNRLIGEGGYMLKINGKYAILSNIFATKEDVTSVNEPQNLELFEVKVSNIDKSIFGSKNKKKCISYMDYADKTFYELCAIEGGIIDKSLDKAGAIDKIYQYKLALSGQYDSFSAMSAGFSEEDFVVKIKTDMTSTIAMLDNLLLDDAARPNLLCDIRYYKIQIILNFSTLVNILNKAK